MNIDGWGIAALLLMGLGTLLMLIAAIGIIRMPDVYLRLHSATKSTTLGLGCVMLGVALHYHDDPGVWIRSLLVILFFLLTAPVGAHMLGRAAHRSGVSQARETLSDDLADVPLAERRRQDHRGAVLEAQGEEE